MLIKKAIPTTIKNCNIQLKENNGIIKLLVKKNNKVDFSIDLAIIKIENNKLNILKNDLGKYIWNLRNEDIKNLKGKISKIKNEKKWNFLREEYKKLKNKNENKLPSYIIYIQAINNIYNSK